MSGCFFGGLTVSEMVDVRRSTPVAKVDHEKQIVWGWAYVCEKLDVQVEDYSGDIFEAGEVEKAAHDFVLESRVGGVMHSGDAGVIVDSLFFSKDVQAALGIDLGRVGWFIGMHVTDADVWKRVKAGELPMFSIAGRSNSEVLSDGA